MDPERGTERLADASFLEELLRGRRTLVVGFGDPAPGQHLAQRLGVTSVAVSELGADGVLPRADRSIDALVALGGFQDPAGSERLIAEARRVLAPGGILAVSWMDYGRPTLESAPAQEPRASSFSPAEATRRLSTGFGFVAVVARQPYLGFQYVSGIDNQGAVPLDTSLTTGGSEAPTGYVAIASDGSVAVGDLLVQVPYDRVVSRVKEWLRAATPAPQPVVQTPPARSAQTVARPRDAGSELDRLRLEVNALRERAQSAVEESDRARGEARTARERAALVDAEVAKLRARVKGAPDPDSGVRAELETRTKELESRTRELEIRTRERDSARRDAEGAAGEAARALEAAARYEREVEFLEQRVAALELELSAAREDREKAVARTVADARDETARLVEALRADADRALVAAHDELRPLREKVERAADVQRRAEQTTKRLREAEQKISDLEAAKAAAERAAEDAWKRVKEAQAQIPAGDVVPVGDLAAAQSALAQAIARAENAEREHRALRENPPVSAADPALIAELEATLATVRTELDAARARSDAAEGRLAGAERAAADAKAAFDAMREKAEGPDVEGLRSLLHQRETAMAAARERAETAEARAARFASESAEALARLKASEDALAERDAEVKKALSALDGLEVKAAREKELIAELKGEVARLTEGIASAREDLAIAKAKPERSVDVRDLDAAVKAAGMAQAEAGKAHAQADALRERLEAADAELARMRAEAEKGSGQDKERERRIAELEAKLLEAKSQSESTGEIERRTVAMSQKLAMLEAELERAKDDVKQASAEARKYRAMAEAIDPPTDRSSKA